MAGVAVGLGSRAGVGVATGAGDGVPSGAGEGKAVGVGPAAGVDVVGGDGVGAGVMVGVTAEMPGVGVGANSVGAGSGVEETGGLETSSSPVSGQPPATRSNPADNIETRVYLLVIMSFSQRKSPVEQGSGERQRSPGCQLHRWTTWIQSMYMFWSP